MSGYLVTGATGFVGGALTLELLMTTDAPIHLLVRDTGTGAERCRAALRAAAESYGFEPDFVSRQQDRLHIVAGDLRSGEFAEQLPGSEISDVWHCAASLKFDDRSRDEIFAVNVDGTARLLDLSERLGVSRFNYMSTAYVTGTAAGTLTETPVPADVCPNNQYEYSKAVAEDIVAKRDSMQTRIWRPSIVVGHSVTYAATSFTGLYGFTREGLRFKRRTEKVFGSNFVMRQRRIQADPAAEINLVPIDLLVRQAVSLSMRPGFDARIIHLTNKSAPTLHEILSAASLLTGIPVPEYVDCTAGFTPIERRFQNTLRFYMPHVDRAKFFTQAVAEHYGSPIDFPMDVDYLGSLLGWYIDHAGLADVDRVA
ncbi:SDR family oxidoreductase [Nocardia sp. NPDC006044]|uniref:SDR family oxidoreductase n=1 Tax=Nocardia sp. NPDC006044 TaxID=3364306 RepID=UPI0036B8A3F8